MCNFCKTKSIKLIKFYQRNFSPDHSFWAKNYFPAGYCKFTPSCSEYTKKSLEKYGFIKGWIKGVGRILRCNPWSKGGNDNP